VCINTSREGTKEDKLFFFVVVVVCFFFPVMFSAGTRINGHKLEQKLFCWEALLYCAGDRALAQIAQGACRAFSLKMFKIHLDIVPGQPTLGVHA